MKARKVGLMVCVMWLAAGTLTPALSQGERERGITSPSGRGRPEGAGEGGGDRTAAPLWYPPTEPSPFLPDAAHWIAAKPGSPEATPRTLYFRGVWHIRGPVRRAVVMTAPRQTVNVSLDGRLTLSGYDEREALPVWADVTKRLHPGDVSVTATVYSEWGPTLYAQMRVEYTDGSAEDLITGPEWECRVKTGADAPWTPCVAVGGYYRAPGEGIWGHDFALLPREQLRERFEKHNARLRAIWRGDRGGPVLKLNQKPERPEWAAQFRDFARVADDTGQLVDGAGRVRHLFFTIYAQTGPGGYALSVPDMDFDQLERDLDLMARTGVHLYMRQTGWDWLLTAAGAWAPLKRQPKGTNLPHFARGIDMLDYFVRRAHAHGLYIVFEGDFYWGAHSDVVPPPYRSRYHIYPEVLEAQALATRQILHHYSQCTNVLGMMIGEEDIVLAHDLANPHQRALFADHLRARYGDLARFKRETPFGYDYTDLSGYRKSTVRPDLLPGGDPASVLVPGYAPRYGVFTGVRSWDDITLPLWPGFRSPDEPELTLGGYRSYNDMTPRDPLWIDFYEMREDELLFGMLSRWSEIVREGVPHQLLFYSNAQDFTCSWHFLHLFRRADLPFDVIGVGCHDSGQDLSEILPPYTVRKAIKVISSYRPYVVSPGSPARGVAPGEGEGGRAEHPEEVLNYYRGALFDEIGGGVAWTQTYNWCHISGADATTPPHETPLLHWFASFQPAVQGAPFPLRRKVEVLVVRNTNLQHSNMSGLDYGNVLWVAEALSQLNVEFDIVMDRDLVTGREPLKIDLRAYRLVIVPTLEVDMAEGAWQALDKWLNESGVSGRVLALGRVGEIGRRLEPRESFPPMLSRWLGTDRYARTVKLRGKQTVGLVGDGGRNLTVDFDSVPPTGVVGVGRPVLLSAAGDPIAASAPVGRGEVVAFGFPLGFVENYLWGEISPAQSPRDAVVPVYEWLAREAGVERPVVAPHNLRVYVAADAHMVLVRERAGLATDADIAFRAPAGVRYNGIEPRRDAEGRAVLHVTIPPWEGRWWKATAGRKSEQPTDSG